jgi:hypothetical protein
MRICAVAPINVQKKTKAIDLGLAWGFGTLFTEFGIAEVIALTSRNFITEIA